MKIASDSADASSFFANKRWTDLRNSQEPEQFYQRRNFVMVAADLKTYTLFINNMTIV